MKVYDINDSLALSSEHEDQHEKQFLYNYYAGIINIDIIVNNINNQFIYTL
jgi:hypothetical protein